MFRFAHPVALYALALVPMLGAGMLYAVRLRRQALERFGDRLLLAKLTATVSTATRTLRASLLLAVVALLLLALARPQFGTRVETVRREGKDVVVALDLSRSMLAEDVSPNRLQRSKLEIQRLIQRLDGDRIGLVAFAGQAFMQSPLTTDYGAAALFLNAMNTELIPVQGTDLGAALNVALDAFADESLEHRVILVITDGEDHEGQVEQATQRAVEGGVRVFTVGVGSADGVPIPVLDRAGGRRGFQRDADGNVVTTQLDETTLRAIASATGGDYYRSAPEAGNLDPLFEQIDALGGREIDRREITQFDEQFQICLGLALLLLMVEMALPDRRRPAQEWRGRFQ